MNRKKAALGRGRARGPFHLTMLDQEIKQQGNEERSNLLENRNGNGDSIGAHSGETRRSYCLLGARSL